MQRYRRRRVAPERVEITPDYSIFATYLFESANPVKPALPLVSSSQEQAGNCMATAPQIGGRFRATRYFPAAVRSAALMRSCQPGPSA
jgi:hypothetical protein